MKILSILKRKFSTFVNILIPLYINKIKLKPGLSFLIRAKNEENSIKDCIMSIIDIADEIVFVDNLSTDTTLSIVQDLAKKYKHIKIYEYKIKIPRCGEEQAKQVNLKSKNTIANYYNWCLDKVTKYNVVKWDADCISNRVNLLAMVEKHNLHTREDLFSLWFTGETLFKRKEGEYYINTESFYDEFRCYSKLNGFHWIDTNRWEAPSTEYVQKSKQERFELPCFYEIKDFKINELASSRTKGIPLDERDKKDEDIMTQIASNNIETAAIKRFPTNKLKRNIVKD